MLADFISIPIFFTKEECQLVKDYSEQLGFYRGKWTTRYVISQVNLLMKTNLEVDINRNDEIIGHLIKRVDEQVAEVNKTLFNFDIFDTSHEANKIHISKFSGEEKAFVCSHQKVNWISDSNHKKIYACVMLSDANEFEGGEYLLKDFAADLPSLPERKEAGRLFIFPCFRYTERTPVLRGNQYMINFVYNGPFWK